MISLGRSKSALSSLKIETYKKDSELIKYWRRNPVIACEDLLGIKLFDEQAYILTMSWNTPHVLWCCSRAFGKTFLGAIFLLLKALLFENQKIYIITPAGSQSKECFTKIEEIILNIGKTSASIMSLKDIVMEETVKSPACKTGFVHAPVGYNVEFYNGSEIITLNNNTDFNRSKRASVVLFDEAGFSSDEQIAVCEAFAAQSSDFMTSIEKNFNIKALRRNCPTQLIYASSASSVDTTFFRHYKEFAKQMFLGNRDFFCCDIPCDIPLCPTMDGVPYAPLLERSVIDSMMKTNRDKAIREYYNKFMTDGGESQIIKWAQIRRSETFLLPEVCAIDGCKYAIAFDPARIGDNSIITIMKIIHDTVIGYYGEIVNCVNLVDLSTKKGFKMTTPNQIKVLKDYVLAYNGNELDYKNVKALYIDPGSGGGGVNAYGDNLLEDWVDNRGIIHKGFLDRQYELYEGFDKKYPNASDILRFYNPKKYKTQMVDELIELFQQDLIRLPKEYSGSGYITLLKENDGEQNTYNRSLSFEEEIALMNIDILKTEMTSMFKFENTEKTTKSYALSKDKESVMHKQHCA